MATEYIKGMPVPPRIQTLPEAGEYLNRLYSALSRWSFHIPTDITAGTYEPAITAGTTAQYWRGDKSWQTLNQAAVAGLTTADSPSFVKTTLTQAVGTSPLTITSTTVCNNLNADLWDGYQFADYLNQAVKTTSSPTFKGIILSTLMPGWLPPKKITLPTPTENLTDFTVWVPITADADIGGNCLSTGYDIRFTLSDGVTLLKYERVSFSVTDGKATGIFWVKVPAISTAGTYIYCWYGNASATDGSTPADSWDAHHVAVYHMQDYDTSHIHDSTANANHGTKKGANEPIEADGKIGKGQNFDGSNDYIDLGTLGNLAGNALTVSLWANVDTLGNYEQFIDSSAGATDTTVRLAIGPRQSPWKMIVIIGDGVGVQVLTFNYTVPTGEWHLYTVVLNNTEAILYVDGGPIETKSVIRTLASGTYRIGRGFNASYYYDGQQDEIRISSVARSAAWIAYEFANQSSADGGLTWGAVPADAIQIYSADYGAGDARMFMRGESGYPMSMGNQSLCGGDQASGNLTLRSTSNATKGIVYSDSYVRATTNRYIRATEIALGSANPGASGATWVDANANTTGGWRVTSSAHVLRGGANIHADWDGASDAHLYVKFISNVDNTGGADTDTVDIKATFYYKGKDDVATRGQVVEVSTVVGKTPQYKGYEADFVIDWDYASNVLKVGDHITVYVNLETDTSEVDDIIIVSMIGLYPTSHIGTEDGDR